MTLRLKLLGRLHVTDDAARVVSLRPRAQRLLAYLMLHRHAALTRERIAFTLWPDSTEAEALGTLRRALSDLRATLPRDYLISTRGELTWNHEAAHWLDVEAYEQLIRQATPAALHDALALYAGDLLEEFDDEWVMVERERLRQIQLSALRRLITHHRTLGEYETALGLARQALSLDPLAEAVYRDQIALHYLSGDRSAALAVYDRLSKTLKDELNAEPMAQTRGLIDAVMQGLPLPDARPANATTSVPTLLPKLIGRAAEIDKLSELWQNAISGQGRLAIVSGEAGVGKSHLASTLAGYVTQSGGLALIGHCYEFERALPYQAVVEMLRAITSLLQHLDLSPAHRAALARLAPDVIGAIGVPAGDEIVSSDELRGRLFEALLQTFLALARNQPLLMLLEDVHWAAESTLDWLTYVAPRVRNSRILIIITYRINEVGAQHALARLERRFAHEGTLAALPIKSLSRDAHRELVMHLSGLHADDAHAIADRLFAETAGNPFFLHEIIRGLIELGRIHIHAAKWSGPLVEATPDAEVTLPDSLRATIGDRVERLSERSRMFIRMAAVAGRVFDYEVVRRAGGWPEETTLDALEDVLARGFVRESETRETFAFAHHLVQEATYADLASPRRAYLHRQLAETIQTLRPHDFESLAHHFALAGEVDRARSYYVQAGDRARELVAMKEAADHYRAALMHWPESDQLGRAETLYKQGQCQWVIFDTQNAMDAFSAALDLHEALGDRVKMGEMERQIGRMYWELGDREASLSHFNRALAILEQGPETVELARAYSSMSQMHMLACEYDEAVIWGERALALAERFGAEDVRVHALNNVGVALISVKGRDTERGLTMLRESLQRALDLRMPHDACRAYTNMGEHLMGQCRYAEARATFEQQYAFALRVYARAFAGDAVRRLCDLDWWSGNWSAAPTRRQQMIEQTWGIWQVRTSRVLSHMYNDLGQAEAARQELEDTLGQAMKWEELQTTIPHLGELARAYAALKLETKAANAIQQLLELLDNNPYLDWESTMPLLFACRWYATHVEWLDAARACLPRLERAQAQYNTLETEAALAEGRGCVALAEGRASDAVAQFDLALACWVKLERPYDQARVLSELGHARVAVGASAEALAAFDHALSIFAALAAQLEDRAFEQSFFDSDLVRETREARAAVEASQTSTRHVL